MNYDSCNNLERVALYKRYQKVHTSTIQPDKIFYAKHFYNIVPKCKYVVKQNPESFYKNCAKLEHSSTMTHHIS